MVELSPGRMRTDFKGLDDVRRADSALSTLASFMVESGWAGSQRM